MIRRSAEAVAVLVLAAVTCAGVASPAGAKPGISLGPIDIEAIPVPLNPEDPSAAPIGEFRYAGGLALSSKSSNRLHGLSDLEVTASGDLSAVSDLGSFFTARLALDEAGRLAGLSDPRLGPLVGPDGEPLAGKTETDAEGLAILPGGDRLVSFERDHRIWLYPAAGGPPRPAPAPKGPFNDNGGMEALAPDPESGADAYVVGAEDSGMTWSCRLSSKTCIEGPVVEKPEEFGLVAVEPLPGARTAYLLRAFDLARGCRIRLRIFRSSELLAQMEIAPPLTVDNFEGVAAVPGPSGALRFYLISDDNALPFQRTLLFAFDWVPPKDAPSE